MATMHQRRAPAGQGSITRGLQESFREHPLRFPILAIVIGWGLLGWLLFVGYAGGLIVLAIDLLAVIGALGVLLLPVGVVVTLRRRLHQQVLRCPHCGAESRACAVPFRVERISYASYAHVTCSRCSGDFTVDKHAVLV
jgi:hypothetical protein